MDGPIRCKTVFTRGSVFVRKNIDVHFSRKKVNKWLVLISVQIIVNENAQTSNFNIWQQKTKSRELISKSGQLDRNVVLLCHCRERVGANLFAWKFLEGNSWIFVGSRLGVHTSCLILSNFIQYTIEYPIFF